MTTASQAELPGTSPATAIGTSMKPVWATAEYASIRIALVWRSAARLPSVIDTAASTQMIGSHESPEGKKPKRTIVRIATKPPAFEATERNAVTGVGEPS